MGKAEFNVKLGAASFQILVDSDDREAPLLRLKALRFIEQDD